MAHPILPFLAGALALVGISASQAQTSTVTAGPNGVSGNTTVTTGPNGAPCRVVRSDAGTKSGPLSTSVTAGPDGVRSTTTGGSSVTTQSRTGSSASAGSTGGTTVTTTGDGDCVVTVPSNRK